MRRAGEASFPWCCQSHLILVVVVLVLSLGPCVGEEEGRGMAPLVECPVAWNGSNSNDNSAGPTTPSNVSNVVIFTFSSFPYRRVVENLVASMRTAQQHNAPGTSLNLSTALHVLCTDEAMLSWCRQQGLNCVALDLPPSAPSHSHASGDAKDATLHNLWEVRLRLVASCLDLGFDVWMNDADAVWLRDPWPFLQQEIALHNPAILAQRGGFPFGMAHKWGATLCFGFVYFRAIASARTVLSLALQLLPHLEADDQLLVNAVLFLLAGGSKQTVFPISQDTWAGILAHSGVHAGDPAVEETVRFTAPSERGRCGAGRPLCYVRSTTTALVDIAFGDVETHTRNTVRVALLGHSQFLRRCRRGFDGKRAAHGSKGPYVAHCYTPKTEAGKLSGFDKHNLWFIQ